MTVFALMLMASVSGQSVAHLAASENKLNPEKAVFEWKSTEYDFGTIKVGEPVSHEFSFINGGDAPLIISTVQASCGCTVTAYTKDPIAPMGTGYVKATYNAAKVGQFSKTVTVNANTEEGVVKLVIKGEVVDKVIQ